MSDRVFVSKVERWTVRLIICFSVMAATLFWWERRNYLAASTEVARVMASRITPFQLSGLELPLPELLSIDNPAGKRGSIKRHLVLVISDTCHFCQQARADLCALVQLPSLNATDEVLLISLDGTTLAKEFATCGSHGLAQMAIGLPLNAMEFVTRTSMAGTPTAVLTDSRWRVQRTFVNGHFNEINGALTQFTHEETEVRK